MGVAKIRGYGQVGLGRVESSVMGLYPLRLGALLIIRFLDGVESCSIINTSHNSNRGKRVVYLKEEYWSRRRFGEGLQPMYQRVPVEHAKCR